MRFYSFVNMYLSGIQKGIQTAHAVSEMISELNRTSNCEDLVEMYMDWADNHKTIIVLNGGNSASLQQTFLDILDRELDLPVVQFFEDEESMNGCLTAVGILVPERIYEGARILRTLQLKETILSGDTARASIVDEKLGKFFTIRYIGHDRPDFWLEMIFADESRWKFTPKEFQLMEILNSASLA